MQDLLSVNCEKKRNKEGNSRRMSKKSPGRIITLLTDFGLRDAYVGVMKGVIAGIAPNVRIIDLTHGIPPQDIRAAGFCLLTAYPFFPQETIHVAVVDPGVGTERRAVAIALAEAVLVGPDNGIFTGLLQQQVVKSAVALDRSEFWLSVRPEFTFHGRDIFAPAAAHLASGAALSRLGTPIDPDTLVRLELPAWAETEGGFSGNIQYADAFGNLVTNIPGSLVAGKMWKIKTADLEIPGKKTYEDVPSGALLALAGSHGFLEIAANSGNARVLLSMNVGDPVEVLLVTSTRK